jgi:hypothetical protein
LDSLLLVEEEEVGVIVIQVVDLVALVDQVEVLEKILIQLRLVDLEHKHHQEL